MKGTFTNTLPVFRGGGRVFGPRPRNYSFKLNKAQKRLAKKSVLSQKLAENEIKVVENFSFEAPRTKEFKTVLTDLGLENTKSLFVLGESNSNVYLSSRNLQKVKVVTTEELNVFDLINASQIVFLEGSLATVQENLTK